MVSQHEAAAPPWCHRLISEFNAADERAIALARSLTPHLGTGFEILSQHQRRHLLQAERIRASSEFPHQ